MFTRCTAPTWRCTAHLLARAQGDKAEPENFGLVCLLGLRIFEAVGADINDLGEGDCPQSG